jgi:tripartite-type tricarboxylate transporter receptor subunit TctC
MDTVPILKSLPAAPIQEARMISIRSVMAIVVAVAAIHLHTSALAGSWPERTVRVITPGAPGSSIDVAARLFAERLAELWGKPVVIDNRPGADGIISVQAFLQGNDGHSLLFAFPGIVTVVPLLHDSLPYDPVNDLVPITSAAYDFLCVAVPEKLPVSTLGDLVTFAKSRPGNLNWAAAPGAPYLTFLEFQRRAGLVMTFTSYRSSAQALPDLMADQIQLTVMPLASALPLARNGQIKLLAVTTPERSAAAPDLMTAIEAGYPELTVEAPLGFFGPKTMPMELRERIAGDVRSLASDPTIRMRLNGLGMVARGSTPAEYGSTLAAQRSRWAALARTYGMRPQ